MKSLEVRVPHDLTADEVRRRLDHAIVHARDNYGEKLGDLEAAWKPDGRLTLLMTVLGASIDGEVEIQADALVVRLQIPGMAALFAGRIRQGVEERLGGLLGSQRA